MFGSCESIFETRPPKKSVSATELQMMEMEISTDLANAEVVDAKISSTTMQLDQLLNMYNHVKQHGIDRTFLSLYNSNGQLNNMIGTHFPSCESVDSEGYPGSNMSKAFLVAMEDEKEGIFAKIGKGIKWIWEKIVNFFKNVWTKIKKWVGLKTREAKKKVEEIKSATIPNTVGGKIKRYICKHPIQTTVAATAAVLAGLYKIYKSYTTYKETMAEPDEVMKNVEKFDNTGTTWVKDKGTVEETIVHGNQIVNEANDCLKELEENEKIGDNLDKIDEMIKKINTFYSTNISGPRGISSMDIDEDEEFRKHLESARDTADHNYKLSMHFVNKKESKLDSNAKKKSFLYRSKYLSKMKDVLTAATKRYTDNHNRKIKEIDMLFNLLQARRNLEISKSKAGRKND